MARFGPVRAYVLWMCVFSSSCDSATQPELATGPDIVVVVLDDARFDDLEFNPAFQRLLGAGVQPLAAYTSSPQCCPARASILTGLLPHNHEVRTNSYPDGGFLQFRSSASGEGRSIGVRLQRAGYQTAFVGKYFNEYPEGSAGYVPSGWDRWYGYFGPLSDPVAYHRYYDYGIVTEGGTLAFGHDDADYLTDVLGEEAVRTVRSWSERPGFMVVNFLAPHGPATPARRHVGAFNGVPVPRRATYRQLPPETFPREMRDSALVDPMRFAEMDWLWRRRQETLLSAGEWVDSLMTTLASRDRPAWLILTSDHGLHLGEWSQPIGKGLPLQEDVQVPFVVWNTSVDAPPTVGPAVSLTDLVPSVLTLAGVSYRLGDFDGVAVLGTDPGPRSIVMEAFTFPGWLAIRAGDTLFVKWLSGTEQWFDLGADEWREVPPESQPFHVRLRWRRAAAAALRCQGLACSSLDAPTRPY